MSNRYLIFDDGGGGGRGQFNFLMDLGNVLKCQ